MSRITSRDNATGETMTDIRGTLQRNCVPLKLHRLRVSGENSASVPSSSPHPIIAPTGCISPSQTADYVGRVYFAFPERGLNELRGDVDTEKRPRGT